MFYDESTDRTSITKTERKSQVLIAAPTVDHEDYAQDAAHTLNRQAETRKSMSTA
jgi:hypothetical protein